MFVTSAMTDPAERVATIRDGLRVIGQGIAREPRLFAIAAAGALVFGALTVVDAWALGWATEHALIPAFRDGTIGAGVLVGIVAIFVGLALLRAAGVVARRMGGGIMAFRLQSQDRRDVVSQYLRLPLAWHQRHPTGQLLSNANADVEAMWAPIMPLPMAVGTIAMMVVAVVQMLLTDVVLALVGLMVFPLVVLANVLYQKWSAPVFTRIQAVRAELSEVAHESFDGAMVVKTLGREGEETQRFAAKAQQLRHLGIQAGRMRAVFEPVQEALPNLTVLVLLAVGVWRISDGLSATGDLVTVAYLLTIIGFPLRSIGWVVGEIPRSVVGERRVRAVLDETETQMYGDRVVPASTVGARVEISHLDYSYDPASPVLLDLNLSIDPGRTIALVGSTASGKSTLATLLMRLVDPDQGAIRLDGIDLRDLQAGELARHSALVPQSAFLFDDTVRENITLGAPFADREVWDALDVAQATEFVSAIGLEAALGERGTTLSGGQRQRLSLARALVRKPRLLILDDATSAVDPEVEARILGAMRRASAATTVILIAYRKATIGLADEVYYLDEGRIVDHGRHDELLERNADYARLVNAYDVDEEALG
jgi:ABC-type multidrug transport system fused ATPase/permease subunit